MGHRKIKSQVQDDFEFDDAAFRKFYKPLSNLPTPPMSTRNSSAAQSPRTIAEDAEALISDFLGKTEQPTPVIIVSPCQARS
jgi:hypothetical protein